MTTGKKQIILTILLLAAGAGLFGYGAVFNCIPVLPEKGDSPAVAKSENALIKEVTIGGVRLDESGKIKQTYTGKAPSACPT